MDEEDSEVGTTTYVITLSNELIDAWKMEKYDYVFDVLMEQPPCLTAAVMDGFEYESDRQAFLERLIKLSSTYWLVPDFKF